MTGHRILPESEGDLFCAEIGQNITMSDYREIFEKETREIIKRYGSIRLLLSFTRPFLGWDFNAAERDLAYLTEDGRKLKGVALLDPPEQVAERWLTLQPMLGGEVKIFRQGEFDTALDWVKSQ